MRHIEIKTVPLPLNKARYEWSIVGEGALLEVQSRFVEQFLNDAKPEAVKRVGPYRVHFIERQPMYRSYLYAISLPAAWWYVVTRPLRRRLDDFYRRVIITFYVWGLANWNQALMPTWKDIKLLKRFREGK